MASDLRASSALPVGWISPGAPCPAEHSSGRSGAWCHRPPELVGWRRAAACRVRQRCFALPAILSRCSPCPGFRPPPLPATAPVNRPTVLKLQVPKSVSSLSCHISSPRAVQVAEDLLEFLVSDLPTGVPTAGDLLSWQVQRSFSSYDPARGLLVQPT